MRKQNAMKKIFSLVLGLVMVIGLAAPVMTADTTVFEREGSIVGGHILITNVTDYFEMDPADWEISGWEEHRTATTVWAVAPVTITVLDNWYGGTRVRRVTDDGTVAIDMVDASFLGEEEGRPFVMTGATFVLDAGIYDVFGSAMAGSGITLHVVDGDVSTQPPTDTTTAPNLNTASTWAHDGINQAFALGLIPQNLQNNYTANATRAEFSALAVAVYETVTGREITGRMQFNDTNDINVQKMGYLGVVSGVGNGNFDPSGTITREQAAVMLARLANVMGQPFPVVAPTFADNAQISSWAQEAVGQIQAAGIMGGVGDNQFNPSGQFTREQSIITMLRMFELLERPRELNLTTNLGTWGVSGMSFSSLTDAQPLSYTRAEGVFLPTYTLRVGTVLAFRHNPVEELENRHIIGFRSYLATNPRHFTVDGSDAGRWEVSSQRHLFDYLASDDQFSNFAGNQGVTVDGDTAWIVLDTPGLFAWFTDSIFANPSTSPNAHTESGDVRLLINVVQ